MSDKKRIESHKQHKVSHSKRLSVWKLLLFASIPFMFAFFVVELGFRMAGYEPRIRSKYPNIEAYFWICDKRLGYRNRPNGSHRYELIKSKPLVTTDRYGYRNGYGGEIRNDTPVIVFVGDSTTFGAEVNDDQTGPSEVAKLFRSEFDIQVLNAGVRGYNTVQAKRMLEECLERFPTTKVVVYAYSGNDFLANLNPISHFPVKAPTVWWNSDELLEVEVEDPPVPWGESFFTPKLIPTPGLRVRITNFMREYSAFLHQVGLTIRKKIIRAPAPIPTIVTLPQGSIGPMFESIPGYAEQIEWARENGGEKALVTLLQQMEHMCLQKGVTFLTTAITIGQEHDSYDYFPALCKQAGVTFIDIKKAFTDDPLTYISPTRYKTYDGHYGLKGTKTYAKALYPALRKILSEKEPKQNK